MLPFCWLPSFNSRQDRVAEALFNLLCRQSRKGVDSGKVVYRFRWRLIIADYNNIRVRLINSPVLEDTNLMLYSINETTVIKWFKNEVRRHEITLLMQGPSLPQPLLCAAECLPPAQKLLANPGPHSSQSPPHHWTRKYNWENKI